MCVVEGAPSLGLIGEPLERGARVLGHPEPGLHGREPSRDPRRQRVGAGEQRLGLRRSREGGERRTMLLATGVQHAGRDVQKHRGGGVDLLL